ncbi:hypothetical protein NL676_033274 [Syzygium grande]|nr:hypothetical protein NL676_033274 [Syzygium grande]
MNLALQWSHGLDRPCYIDVFRLSKLRSNSKHDTYQHASKLGFCIILGSLWNCEWSLFCYGPPLPDARGSFPSKVSGIGDSFYAWALPSELSISVVENDYKFPKRFKYLKLDYLYSFVKGNLASELETKIKRTSSCPREKASFDPAWHVAICKMLKASGFQLGSPSALAFDDIRSPTTVGEIMSRKEWAGLPIELLLLAFSGYSEFVEVLLDQKKVSLEFLVVPEMEQLQPFFLREPSFRSNKWSKKVHRSDALVGPVLPVHFLSTLYLVRDGSSEASVGLSPETELGLRFGEVMQVAPKMAMLDSGSEVHDEHAVSLANDKEETWTASELQKPFFFVPNRFF